MRMPIDDPLAPMGRVLIVAGSDPSGGAGVQADIKTITMLGQYAASAITALTVQNTKGVSAVEPVPLPVISGQIQAVLSDIGADVVKTGMLHSASVIETVAATLDEQNYTGQLVVDPVMVATSGDRLLDENAIDALKTRLIARADVLTPNIPEAAALTGLTIECPDDMLRAAEALRMMGAKAVVMKGGHGQGETLLDIFVGDSGPVMLENPRQHTRHTHGTGCTLASAMAALLAVGQKPEDAFRASVAFVQAAIKAAPGFGAGHGPLGHARVRLDALQTGA